MRIPASGLVYSPKTQYEVSRMLQIQNRKYKLDCIINNTFNVGFIGSVTCMDLDLEMYYIPNLFVEGLYYQDPKPKGKCNIPRCDEMGVSLIMRLPWQCMSMNLGVELVKEVLREGCICSCIFFQNR